MALMENHPTIRMKKKRYIFTLLTHCLLVLFCCVSHSKEPTIAESKIQKISRRAVALMTEPFYGAGEIGHFIAIDAQDFFQSKEGKKSSSWMQLTAEEKAALKRFVDPSNSQIPKQIVESEDFLFASDIAAIIDPEGEVDDLQRVRNAVTGGNICFTIVSEAKRGMDQREWDSQYKKVKAQMDHYQETKRFSRLFMKLYNKKIANLK